MYDRDLHTPCESLVVFDIPGLDEVLSVRRGQSKPERSDSCSAVGFEQPRAADARRPHCHADPRSAQRGTTSTTSSGLVLAGARWRAKAHRGGFEENVRFDRLSAGPELRQVLASRREWPSHVAIQSFHRYWRPRRASAQHNTGLADTIGLNDRRP
jgi:hypothetical protein